MKPLMTRSLAILSVSSMLATGAAYAASPEAAPVQIQPISANLDVTVQVNGTALTDLGFLGANGAEAMLPLRAVTESLGFKLTWHPETYSVDLVKGNVFTTVKTGEDRYTINKMFTELGTAPQLVDSKLYVPASFVKTILHGSVATEGNAVSVSLKEEAKKVQSTGVITSIQTIKPDHTMIHIQDVGTGGIVLNVGPETTYQMLDGSELTLADLHVGLTITAEHSLAMTMSLPPQTSASNITVLDTAVHKGSVGTAGVIEDVRENGSLLLKGEGLSETSPDEVVLTVSADTAIVDGKGEPVDKAALTKGAKIIGFYGPMMTKSLPPISQAWKIVVETDNE
ncbi:copper amine oxidase N-terminal domain-containing protein [Paenibacillus roseipurpureus]|uniref:Copper amine oxidase N-terminal domain-containing protein n=1 Tax=Paenibacillus roseopurpureus TaxID=2918901 RepID=A0AA96LNS3_9BACL|nr:copper amine oxidase N-terminal domain-containing protein [Paenibacillus sp. MBLB1832]WNR44506.1 copper amine oxidase N-terminal domain-containing protein [Paenibacillus sp. MBLB1832]